MQFPIFSGSLHCFTGCVVIDRADLKLNPSRRDYYNMFTSWSLAQRNRLGEEKVILAEYFKDQVTWINQTNSSDTRVELQLESNSDTKYTLRLYLDSDFPNACPHMAVVSPAPLTMKSGRELPLLDNHFHTLGLTVDGFTKLCHYDPDQWSPENTLYLVFMKGLLWIEAYEGHLATGNNMDFYLKHQNGTPMPQAEVAPNANEANNNPPGQKPPTEPKTANSCLIG